MPKGMTPKRVKVDADAQDLVSELGIRPMTVDEIVEHYDRTLSNVQQVLLPRARTFARANGIVIDRPIRSDNYRYHARWDWTGDQRPNWITMLTDVLSRTTHIRQDIENYTANAQAEGKVSLAEYLGDIHDLFKVTVRSIAKARLEILSES